MNSSIFSRPIVVSVLVGLVTVSSSFADESSHRRTTGLDDKKSSAEASGADDHTHSLRALGMGTVVEGNNVQGVSAGVAAQFKLRENGRLYNTLYDERFNATYNMISAGQSGASTTASVRDEIAIGYAVQDIRNTCSFYGGVSAYGRGALASGNNTAANSFRMMVAPETGLACDVSGVLLEISPIVGLGASTNASTNLTTATESGGTAVMAGGALRVSINDRLHISARASRTIPGAAISGGPTGDMTMAGADVDFRVSDRWTVGVTADAVQYGADPTPAAQGGAITRSDAQVAAVVQAVF